MATPQYKAIMAGDHWVDAKGQRWEIRDLTYEHLFNLIGYLEKHVHTYYAQHIRWLTEGRAQAEAMGQFELAVAYGSTLLSALEVGPHTFVTSTALFRALHTELKHRHKLAIRKNRLERKSRNTETVITLHPTFKTGDVLRFVHTYNQE